MSQVNYKIEDGKIIVTSPYNSDFVKAVRNINGKWTGNAWSVPAVMGDQVKNLLLKHYGTTGNEPTKTYIITAKKDIDELCGPVCAGGLVIAQARGRDSGAKTLDGVYLLDGDIDSTGSVKNWRTWVEKDSTFQVSLTDLQAERIAASESLRWKIEEKKDEKKEQTETKYIYRFEIYDATAKKQIKEVFFSSKDKADAMAKKEADGIEAQTIEPSKTLYALRDEKGHLIEIAVSRLILF